MNDSNCTLYIVRHGETSWNVQHRIQGQVSHIGLNESGKNQAGDLARRLRKIKFDAVFSSDAVRTRETAEIITLEKNIAIQTTEALRERSFGRFQGTRWDTAKPEIRKLLENMGTTSKRQFEQYGIPDAENDDDLMGRFIPFLREIAVAYAGKTVLVVTHGGTMRAFLVRLGYATYETLRPGAIANSGYVRIESDGVDFFVKETIGVNRSL